MGYNTTLVVLNDALHQIENDPEFGKKVARAAQLVWHGKAVDISSGNHCNAATVIESHHADEMHLIAVGGNYGQKLGYVGSYRAQPLDMLKSLADQMGYNISKKRTRRK